MEMEIVHLMIMELVLMPILVVDKHQLEVVQDALRVITQMTMAPLDMRTKR